MEEDRTPTVYETMIAFGLTLGLIVFILVVASHFARARDIDGKYAKENPELHSWFESLTNQYGGFCCAEADGMPVSDGDWGTENGEYWVIVPSDLNAPRSSEGRKVQVPSDALVKQANRVGHAMVWPMWSEGGVTVRCFMAGTLS